jgi:hypothetical protein
MNDMTISQAATILGEAVEQATGQKVITSIDTPEQFVSVAQTALKTGYDPIINALSQIWSSSIYAVRDYSSPLTSLEMDLTRYGNALRKISPIAAKMQDDQRFIWPVAYDATNHKANALGNGESVDMYKISKQEVLQTNFYGTAVYQQRYTTFKDQFDVAMSSADEFMRFNAMNMTERNNDKESYREAVARGMQANFIAAILDEGQKSRVVHLLSEYNAETGLSLSAQSVYQPDNFAPFMRWVYARLNVIARFMGERSQLYQTVINAKPVLRHTRGSDLRVALYSKAYEQMRTMALSTTFHDDYLKLAKFEGVNFWQSIETPDSVNITPVYTSTAGAVKKASKAVEQAGIFGIMHDRDALGYCYTNKWSATTPLNIDGGYWNTAEHATIKTIQDNTEKAVVLLLD